MIEWIISSSVLILFLIGLRYCLKGKISLRLQYALWGLVLVRLLLPFSIGSSELSIANFLPESLQRAEVSYETEVIRGQTIAAAPIFPDNSSPKPGNEAVSGIPNLMTEDTSLKSTVPAESGEFQEMKTERNLFEVWMIVWLLGGLLTGSVLLIANVIFAGRLRKSRQNYEVEGVKLPVYLTGAVDTPCLFGIVRPSIYLTPSAVEHPVALRHIVEHETTHYRHGDHIWAMLRGVCLAIHWYNPLVWWAAALSRADAELACDEGTIARIGEEERAEYGRTLINMTCQKRAAWFVTATTMTGSKNGIKERITLLVKRPKMAAYTLTTVILLALFAVGCTFTGNEETIEQDILTPTPAPTITLVPEEKPTVTPTVAVEPEATPAPVEELPEEEDTPDSNSEFVFDMDAELLAVEESYKEKYEILTQDTLTQGDMNTLAGECAILWEDAMADFWNVLESLLTAEEAGELHKEQQEWLTMRDVELQKIIKEYDGGSITGLVVGMKKTELTRERVYELAEYLKKRWEQMAEAPQKDFSGHYINTEGTDVIYDELKLELLGDGTYQAEIGIYRITTLEGTAVVYGDMLVFDDAETGVKGNIQFSENMAVFTVTESGFEYITPGEGFEFMKSE